MSFWLLLYCGCGHAIFFVVSEERAHSSLSCVVFCGGDWLARDNDTPAASVGTTQIHGPKNRKNHSEDPKKLLS